MNLGEPKDGALGKGLVPIGETREWLLGCCYLWLFWLLIVIDTFSTHLNFIGVTFRVTEFTTTSTTIEMMLRNLNMSY